MVRIRDIEHDGHRAVELVHRGVRAVIATSIGPRIAWFGHIDRGNLLYWDRDGKHRHGEWRLYGGHRLWVTRPGADESEEIYAPDNAPCAVRRAKDGVVVTAPITPTRIEKTLAIRVRDGEWLVEHRLRNRGDLLWSGGAWALTCTRPVRETRYRIPLGGGPPAWDVTTIVIPTRWGGTHTSQLDDSQIRLSADAMEIRATGAEAKRMVLAPQGIFEMHDARGLFRKHVRYDAAATYPLGTNLAVYLGPRRFMVEMESMSLIRTLAPDETLIHNESWTLQ